MSKKNSRKDKWRHVSLNPTNIDEYLYDLIEDTKGQYITQGVSFNKNDTFQMGLLKQAILDHSSFSGLVKHLLTLYYSGQLVQSPQAPTASIYNQTNHSSSYSGIQEYIPPVRKEQDPETKISQVKDVVADKVEDNEVQTQQPRPRSVPKKKLTGGGAFLRTNPNAKPPKDPSTL